MQYNARCEASTDEMLLFLKSISLGTLDFSYSQYGMCSLLSYQKKDLDTISHMQVIKQNNCISNLWGALHVDAIYRHFHDSNAALCVALAYRHQRGMNGTSPL
jgi:hypothetical protein